jgi:6-pyruvoyltetrahydropterin/6-carboxytetrahydropterin synthase
MDLYTDFHFEAAHQLPGVPPTHMCARLHGHSYSVRVTVRGDVDPSTGWVMDFGQILAAIEPVRARLDHRYLNDIDGLANPTSENLACWLWKQLSPAIPLIHEVEVREMPNFGCIYRGHESGRLD